MGKKSDSVECLREPVKAEGRRMNRVKISPVKRTNITRSKMYTTFPMVSKPRKVCGWSANKRAVKLECDLKSEKKSRTYSSSCHGISEIRPACGLTT